uniref:Sulfhydryl oxidase 1-like n=1 Tax=Drosophila rhopaloa TaxID=1041015 RepID=A0A6P4G0R2_DRORH
MTRPPEPLILVMALLNLLFFTIQATHYHQSFVHRDKPRTSVLEGHRRSSNTILENKLLAPALGKLVLFYSNSCHDCLSFASTLHKLSHQLNNWRQVLAIYKVDCEESIKVCHDFQIQHLPTLRFFHSNFERDRDGIGIGIEIRSRNIRGITTKIATLLASNSYKGVLHHKPVFKTLQSQETLKSLFHKDNVSRYLVLVFQPRHSQIGVNTLLDMLPHHEVTVRIVENPQLFANFGLQPFAQKLVLFDRNGVSHPLIPARDSSKAYVDSLKKLLRTLAQNSRTVLRDFSWKNRKSQIQGRTQDLNDKGDENNKHDLSLNQNNRRIINHVLNEPLKIYQADIEMAIGILLHIEIPKIKVIKEKALNALKMFLDVLIHLSPVSQVKTQLLRDLLSWLKNNDKLTGLDFIDLVNCYEK